MVQWVVTVHSADKSIGDTGVVEADDEDGAKAAMLAEYADDSPVKANPVFAKVVKL
jgi:hypothetical protein